MDQMKRAPIGARFFSSPALGVRAGTSPGPLLNYAAAGPSIPAAVGAHKEFIVGQNFLQVSRADFKLATKVFCRKRLKLGPVLLSFENGFLFIESGEITKVTRAEGEWHGRATFSPEILRALATVPPTQDPIPISYADGHLLIGSMTVICDWTSVSMAVVQDLVNPGLVDMLALARTMPRHEILGTTLGRRIRGAVEKAERRIKNAAGQLVELEVTESAIRTLVEARIATRLSTESPPVK
ncbi:MAG: hypothetical protein AABM64_00880 [Pseudomonadota bacterium]